jgi:very-short-patch-repair endonuclease
MFYDKLKEIWPSLKQQQLFDWCRNIDTNIRYRFDFVIPEICIIIELDGRQHFEQVSNWDPPEVVRQRDIYKMLCANENGYSTIRILQEYVWYTAYNWLSILLKQIEKIKASNEILNIFLHRNHEYDIYLKELEAIGGTPTNVINRFIKVQ